MSSWIIDRRPKHGPHRTTYFLSGDMLSPAFYSRDGGVPNTVAFHDHVLWARNSNMDLLSSQLGRNEERNDDRHMALLSNGFFTHTSVAWAGML